MACKTKIYLRTLKKIVIILSLLSNLLLIILIFTPVTNLLYEVLEIEDKAQKSDAIILLLAECYSDEILGRNSFQRMHHAYNLYQKKFAPKIFICGSIPTCSIPATLTIKKHLITMGVPGSDIIEESRSLNTYENILYVKPLLRKADIKSSLLVTSSYHMFRSLNVCKKLQVKVYPSPVPCFEKKISHQGDRSQFIREILREYGAITYSWFHDWI